MTQYEIRDPIHTTITFSDREKEVIDHPFVQKLRFIRQCGLKTFVYPGAVNDRFSHALGPMHLAGRIFDVLNKKSKDFRALPKSTRTYLRQTFRFAALLHDVGHGPFSHASESLMPKLGRLDIPKSWFTEYNPKKRATHEDYGVLLIRTLGTPREKIFTPAEAQDIASLVHKKLKPSSTWKTYFKDPAEARGYHAFFRRLISGELDVDRMDYLLRDAYFTGVPYGNFDIEWLIGTLNVIIQGKKPMLAIESGGLRAFEDFLLARYHMFLQVYYHRTSAAFDYFIEQAIREREIKITVSADPYVYADLRDGRVIEALFEAAKNKKNFWSREVITRRPPKHIYRLERGKPEREKRHKTIIKTLKEAGIYYFEVAARRMLSEQIQLEPGASGILVAEKFLGKPEYAPVEVRSELLQKYNEKIDLVYLFVLREDYKKALKALRDVR